MSGGLFCVVLKHFTVNNIQSLIYTQMYNSFIDSENKELWIFPQNQKNNLIRSVVSELEKTSNSIYFSRSAAFCLDLHKCP